MRDPGNKVAALLSVIDIIARGYYKYGSKPKPQFFFFLEIATMAKEKEFLLFSL